MPGPVVQAGEHGVGAVDLVAGGAEVLPDRAEVGAAGGAVLHQPGGLRLVRELGGAGMEAQLGFQRLADRAGADEADQVLGETGACGRAARQMASRRAVTWSTAPPRASAAAMPSSISRSYSARSGSWLSSTPGPGDIGAGPAGRVAGCGGPGRLIRPGAAAVDAVRLSCWCPGGPRARSADGAGLPVGFRLLVIEALGLGGDAEELLQVLEGDQAVPADLDVGQVAAAHLVVEQVAGQAGQASGLIDGVGQLPARRVLAGRAGGRGGLVAGFVPDDR